MSSIKANVIRIVNKSKFWRGAGIGLLIGAGMGTMIYLANKEEGGIFGPEAAIVFWGLPLSILGGIIGLGTGKDETIQFEGKSDSEIQNILEDLRRKARIKNYQ
jgi:hypothetical protein